jgi:hypothetical protein
VKKRWRRRWWRKKKVKVDEKQKVRVANNLLAYRIAARRPSKDDTY